MGEDSSLAKEELKEDDIISMTSEMSRINKKNLCSSQAFTCL